MAHSPITRRRVLAALAGMAAAGPARATEPIAVVASFSILGDLVRAVGGDHVRVIVLVGPDQDAHGYQPRPSDARAVAAARVLVRNGLGYEGWMVRLAGSAGFKGVDVEAAAGARVRRAGVVGQAQGPADPHAWQSVVNVMRYVGAIRDGLRAADPTNAASYEAATSVYLTQLAALEAEIRAAWASVPRERRRIVTSHDAFAYYADAYGVDFLAPRGALADSEPTPRQIAALIAQIRKDKVRALFLENIAGGQALEQIARETGARIGGRVYSDALSAPGRPAGSYIAMMRHNTRLFTEAVR